MARFLKTRAQRFFATALVLFVGVAGTAALTTEEVIEPARWYFYTTDGSQIDIRSPNSRNIIDADFYPERSWPAYSEMSVLLNARCDASNRNPVNNPIGAEHRGVTLCNAFNVTGDEFNLRHSYFKTRVDELYSLYYGELARHYMKFIGVGLGAWLALLTAWVTFRWISRGEPAHQ